MPWIYTLHNKKIIWEDPKCIFTNPKELETLQDLVTQQDLGEGKDGIEDWGWRSVSTQKDGIEDKALLQSESSERYRDPCKWATKW